MSTRMLWWFLQDNWKFLAVGALVIAVSVYIIGIKAQLKMARGNVSELKGQVAELRGEKAELNSAYLILAKKTAECNKAVSDLKKDSDARQKRGAAALAVAKKKAETLQKQSAWLDILLAKPVVEGKTCKDALDLWRSHE